MRAMTMLEAMQPLSRKPVAERVVQTLLELIRAGNPRAGGKLPTESALAAALQVSRPVVREALRGLSILGVVKSRRGARCFITDLSPSRLVAPLQMVIAIDASNFDALYEARGAIEGGYRNSACDGSPTARSCDCGNWCAPATNLPGTRPGFGCWTWSSIRR
jgi:GntR family transcriptional regulator, transcriptional repressor for pyruvate dehydrogenase complex